MWNSDNRSAFQSCVDDLLCQADVQQMDSIRQHANGVSCLDHSIFVSYLSYLICRRFGYDYRSAARAALLHDMYLCDWSATTISRWRRLLIHPRMALTNAESYDLSDLEKDIILKHMWPVTLRLLPSHRESVVVNIADKICATAEMLRIYRLVKVGERLVSLCKQTPLPIPVV